MPASLDEYPSLTPLQRAIYETDQLGLTLRDSMRLVTARMGYFVGQHRYLQERVKIERFIQQYGPPAAQGWDPARDPREATHQIGSP
jgi:hypothetical protein